MQKAKRYTTDDKQDEQLTKDLQIIKQIAERYNNNKRANKVMQENADRRRDSKRSL